MSKARSTQVRINPETADALREIAEHFGYVVSRGVGAGEIGNTAAMLDKIAERWREDAVRVQIRMYDLLLPDEASEE